MAAGYDGSIRIDTRLDTSGFNKGTKTISSGLTSMIGSLKKFGAAVGIAFAVKKVVEFGGVCVSAAEELSNAMMGLQSIMEGQGRSFQKAKQFVEEYVSDGLVSATQATTAYKNLALRGYDDSQIQQVMTALKDAAAFGRQASYSLGEAVVSAAEGLKNENSVLVDNAGVTKNVAKMWEDYAKSIGTTANNLTQQQKIQAEVNGILEETKFQTGDAAKIANSYSGQVLQLGFAFNNLKVAVGNAIMPLLESIIPPITKVINWFTRLANVVAQVSAVLFGKTVSVNTQVADSAAGAASSTSSMANSLSDAGNAAEKAGKQAKSALASFDELNVLATDAGAGETPSFDVPAVGGGGSTVTTDVETNLDIDESLIDKLDDLEFDYLAESWENLKRSVDDFLNSSGFSTVKEVVKGIAELLVEDVNHAIGDIMYLLADCLDYWTALSEGDFEGAINASKNALLDIVDILMRPGVAFFDAVFGTNFTERYDEMVRKIREFDFGSWMMERFEELAAYYPTKLTELSAAWDVLKKEVLAKFDEMKTGFKGFFDEIVRYYPEKIEAMKTAWATLKDDFALKMAEMKTSINTTMDEIKTTLDEKWGNIKKWFNDNVAPKFTKAYWKEKFNGIKEGAREAFNGIIGIVEKAVNGIIRKLNTLHWSIPSWVPGVGGKSFGFDIDEISIPRLATGAVIPPNQEFLAVLGDQKSGRNLEAPEGLIRQIMREELSGLDIGGGDINIEFTGSLAQLARVLNPVITKEQKRIGKTLQTGGVL